MFGGVLKQLPPRDVAREVCVPTPPKPARVGVDRTAANAEDVAVVQVRGGGRGPGEAASSGKLRFTSRRLVRHLHRGGTSLQTRVADHLESFYWVLLYAALWKPLSSIVDDGRRQRRIRTIFCQLFGGTSAEEVIRGRAVALDTMQGESVMAEDAFVVDNVSLPLRDLLWQYNRHLRDTAGGDRRPSLVALASLRGDDPQACLEADLERLDRVFNHVKMMESLKDTIAELANEVPVGGL